MYLAVYHKGNNVLSMAFISQSQCMLNTCWYSCVKNTNFGGPYFQQSKGPGIENVTKCMLLIYLKGIV